MLVSQYYHYYRLLHLHPTDMVDFYRTAKPHGAAWRIQRLGC
ncbi:hypothetical protein N9094_00555 [bacterium]|nr:hypothetical protein [bacterium]